MATSARPIDWLNAWGKPSGARLARWRTLAKRAADLAESHRSLDNAQLARHSRELIWRAQSGVPLRRLLVDAFALVREASRRTIGLEHYVVQLMGGIALLEEGIAEMQTGEGKTLTAVLPAYLRGICGEGCHIVTVNDYLAHRDAETMRPVFELLGLSVGCIQSEMTDDDRRGQYDKDITYGTAKELGFDFLRDRLRMGADSSQSANGGGFSAGRMRTRTSVMRGCHFALIDEADSILLDEARTPLVVGINQPNEPSEVSLYRWCDRVAAQLQPIRDYTFEPARRAVDLTDAGCRQVVLKAKPVLIDTIDAERIYRHVELALTARIMFDRDRDYVVRDDEVLIVDESTGRIMDGRKWQDGLHHAVEAKERVSITAATDTGAKITIQSFFRQYSYLAGMTGTAVQATRELRKAYRLRVTSIPTHKPCIRTLLPTRIFATMDAKRRAVVAEVEAMRLSGRPVLVGTPSVAASEALSTLISAHGIPHHVLNAHHDDKEAEIVSHAGERANVTIATNMAGRGTDIMLAEEVRASGGLHVIATEMHSSGRIDRQLIGRAARQGDPGSCRFFLSFEDELFRAADAAKMERVRKGLSPDKQGEVGLNGLRHFNQAQRSLERRHRKERRDLIRHEKKQYELYGRIGLDPYLELTGH